MGIWANVSVRTLRNVGGAPIDRFERCYIPYKSYRVVEICGKNCAQSSSLGGGVFFVLHADDRVRGFKVVIG